MIAITDPIYIHLSAQVREMGEITKHLNQMNSRLASFPLEILSISISQERVAFIFVGNKACIKEILNTDTLISPASNVAFSVFKMAARKSTEGIDL